MGRPTGPSPGKRFVRAAVSQEWRVTAYLGVSDLHYPTGFVANMAETSVVTFPQKSKTTMM